MSKIVYSTDSLDLEHWGPVRALVVLSDGMILACARHCIRMRTNSGHEAISPPCLLQQRGTGM